MSATAELGFTLEPARRRVFMLDQLAVCRPERADGDELKRIARLLAELNQEMLDVLRARARYLADNGALAWGPSWPRETQPSANRAAKPPSRRQPREVGPKRLSQRQVAIVVAFLRGESAVETAARLGLKRDAVYRRRDTIRRRVLGSAAPGESTFTEAVEEVIRQGLFAADGTPVPDVLQRAIGHRTAKPGEQVDAALVRA